MNITYQKNIELQPKVLRNGCMEVDSNELVRQVRNTVPETKFQTYNEIITPA